MAGIFDRLAGIGGAAGTGATVGSVFGPWGTAIGAGLGAGVGALGAGMSAGKRSEEEEEMLRRQEEQNQLDRLMRMRESLRTQNLAGINQLFDMRQAAMANTRGMQFRDGLLRSLTGA